MGKMIDMGFTPKRGFAKRVQQSVARALLGGLGLSLVTFLALPFETHRGAVALIYLMIVAFVSLTGDFVSSACVAIASTLCLRYFLAPPPSTPGIDKPLDVAALITFLATATIITRLISKMQRLTEELRRREAYLAEAQRLSHTGSFGWKPSTGEIIWSEETFRIFQYSRSANPTIELILQRVHPEDAPAFKVTSEQASRDRKDFEHEYRLVMPDGAITHVHVVAHADKDESGEIEFVGAVMDVTDRKLAAEDLLRTETYLAEGQKLSHTATWASNIATREMIHSSKEHRRLFGLAAEGVEIPPFEEFYQRIHPDDRGPIVEDLERAMAAGTDVEAHFRVVLPEGTTRYMYGVGRPLVKPSSETSEFVGAVMDVTEQKQAEEALRRSEGYLAEAQRLSRTGSWAQDVATDEMKYSSEEFYRVLGLDPHDGPPRFEAFLQRVHPDDQAKVREITDKARREKKEYELDYRVIHPGGDIRDIHVIGHPVFSPSGDLVEFTGTVIDITDRKRAEEALRRSEGYLADAQRLTRTGSWAWNVATRQSVYWSKENYRLFGFDPEGGIPSAEVFFQRIHPEDRDRVRRETILESLDEDAHFDVDFRIVLPGEAIKYVRSTGHLIRNISGDLLEYVGTSIDVTERKRADEERERLRQVQADLAHVNRVSTMGELTASLAHEVNQPIAAAVTSANSCIRWLDADVPNLDKARAAAMRIVNDGTRAAEIISRIRLLFQKGTLELELVDVNEVIKEMIVLLRGEATRQSISVRTELAADLLQVMGDRVQLQQVIMNLMMNSIDAMKTVDGARELAIQSQRTENEQLLVTVSDTGVGIPPQQSDQIFDAFFTTKPHGTGMGLRICRSIVESHGGRLWAANNSGCGASFLFALSTKVEAKE